MKYVLTIGIIMLAIVLGALFYAWSGIYDIAATAPHHSLTLSLIEMLRDRSIKVRSEEIQMQHRENANRGETAVFHYHEMCRLCHGAPGYPPEDFSRGLYPAPPDMTAGLVQARRSEAAIYWIIKHGIKMTGMPAFGPSHEEEDLWSIAALAEEMPRMNREHYRQLVKAFSTEKENSRSNHERIGHRH